MKPAAPKRVIIDTDPGVDDALAILLALRSPELDVVAITTVCGNVPVGQATRNLYRVLNLLKSPSGMLIGQGAARPLQESLVDATHVHGADGMGALDQFTNPDGSLRYPESGLPSTLPTAQVVWKECVRRYPDDLTLITLRSLTNLALALKVDPLMVGKFRDVICMGGAMATPGNVTPAAEFNFFVDPHAAQRVLEAGLPLTVIPLDVTTQVHLTRKTLRTLTAKARDPVARFMGDATGPALAFAEKVEGHGLFRLHDPLAIGVAIDPTLVKVTRLHVQVEIQGQATKGMTLADRRLLQPPHKPLPNLQVAMKVNAARFLKLFRERLCRK